MMAQALDIWAPRPSIITRRRGVDLWVAYRAGDEHHGARGYGDTESAAIRNLQASFPDDGVGFAPEAHASILGAATADLRRKLEAAAPDVPMRSGRLAKIVTSERTSGA
jgi:hypothetical protein